MSIHIGVLIIVWNMVVICECVNSILFINITNLEITQQYLMYTLSPIRQLTFEMCKYTDIRQTNNISFLVFLCIHN